MYACKLHFNGIARKVLIDDFVPVRKDGESHCWCSLFSNSRKQSGKVLSAHTSNKRDMWVTLLEKAFIKLMGGSYLVQGAKHRDVSQTSCSLVSLQAVTPELIFSISLAGYRRLSLSDAICTRVIFRRRKVWFDDNIIAGSPDLFSPVVTGSSESANLANDPKWNVVWYQLLSGFRRGS